MSVSSGDPRRLSLSAAYLAWQIAEDVDKQ